MNARGTTMFQSVAAARELSDFISLAGVPSSTLHELLDLAAGLKRRRGAGQNNVLRGRSVALLFENPSLRTRTTFEVGVHQPGGHPIYLRKEAPHPGVR